MEKVLVTGANGLLGAHVVRELLNRRYSVRAMVRQQSNLKALEGLEIEFFFGQVTEIDDIAEAAEDCSFIIHAAARTAQKPSGLEHYMQPNITSTVNCIKVCRNQPVKRLVYVSTANCFGNGTIENPGSEMHPFNRWMKKSGYAYSKYLAQQKVLGETQNKKLDAVVVNPTFIIGAYDAKPGSGQIFSHILNKKIAFYPPGGKNFVDAESAAIGVVNAMKKGRTGECYLLAGENMTYKNFFKITAEIAGEKPLRVPVSRFLFRVLGVWGDFSEKVLNRPLQINSVNARMLCMDNYYTAAKATKELGLPLTSVGKAAEKAIGWFRKNEYF
jgi:dihydroflavonol-4-reductase